MRRLSDIFPLHLRAHPKRSVFYIIGKFKELSYDIKRGRQNVL